MSLRLIVAALGGDIHSGGRSANVPAPGHSRADRSVSLLLDGDRVVIHGFGAADWRAVREHLQGLGFIDPWGRLNSQGVQPRLRGGDPAFPCARHPSDGGRRYPSLQRRQRSCCSRHRKGPHPPELAARVAALVPNGRLSPISMSEDLETAEGFAEALAPTIRDFLSELHSRLPELWSLGGI